MPKLSSVLRRGPTQLASEPLQCWQPNTCWTLLLGQGQFSHHLTMLSSLMCNNTLLLTSGSCFFGLPAFFRESCSLLLIRLWLCIRISFISKFAIKNVLFCWDGIRKETKLQKSCLQYRIQIQITSAMNKASVSNANEKKYKLKGFL